MTVLCWRRYSLPRSLRFNILPRFYIGRTCPTVLGPSQWGSTGLLTLNSTRSPLPTTEYKTVYRGRLRTSRTGDRSVTTKMISIFEVIFMYIDLLSDKSKIIITNDARIVRYYLCKKSFILIDKHKE